MTNSLSDTIIQLLGGLQNINFEIVWLGFLGYIAFMWFITTLWVYFDARKRYQSKLLVVALTIFVGLCSIPALILYVMMRPEYTKDELVLIQEGIANIFIKNGSLLNAPISAAVESKTEKKVGNIEKNSVDELKENVEVPVIEKNSNDEIEISHSFLQSLQVSFEIIFYTIATFYQNVVQVLMDGIKYLTSIKIEFKENNAVDSSNDKIINTENDTTSRKPKTFSAKKSQITQKSAKKEKSTTSVPTKNMKIQKEDHQSEVKFQPNRKKIPPVKFVLK